MIDINIFRITEVEAYKSRQNLNYGVMGFFKFDKVSSKLSKKSSQMKKYKSILKLETILYLNRDHIIVFKTRHSESGRISDSEKLSSWISDVTFCPDIQYPLLKRNFETDPSALVLYNRLFLPVIVACYRNVQGQKIREIFTGGPVLAHTTQSDRCASGALTGLCRYATYCTNEVAPMRDAKVVAPTNPTQHRRSRLIVAKFNISYTQMSFMRNSIFAQLMFLVITPARRAIIKPLLNPIIIYYGVPFRNTNLRGWTTQKSAYLFLQNDMLALPVFHHTEGLLSKKLEKNRKTK
ncbi:hypothetical protein G5I_06736 [Acromyrmex echinatior]|uniref:Uncharacterized protein n=1 Tax=Acromyrmex echinatior TaxID=103372 RepID=F4WLV5_ACREC|nr:hypothetical protein G5I_06736 [Acromyrmex echinatior]